MDPVEEKLVNWLKTNRPKFTSVEKADDGSYHKVSSPAGDEYFLVDWTGRVWQVVGKVAQ